MALRHERNTYILRGHIFTVRNQLGLGWKEDVYHTALAHLFGTQSIPYLSKPRRSLIHRGIEVHTFEPDLIPWNQIILELKVLPGTQDFPGEMYAQLIHYLKFFELALGFLINFGGSPIVIKRVVWDESKPEIFEDVSLLNMLQSTSLPSCILVLRQIITSIANQYGLGYPDDVYRQIIEIESNHQGLRCISGLTLTPIWNEQSIGKQSISHLMINNECLLLVRSLVPRPTSYDFAITRTYMKNLGVQYALVVNFGQKQLQFFATQI